MVLEKVCQKYFTEFLQTDIHLLLGTTQQYHFVAATPFCYYWCLSNPT
jgi:hypothetical protein